MTRLLPCSMTLAMTVLLPVLAQDRAPAGGTPLGVAIQEAIKAAPAERIEVRRKVQGALGPQAKPAAKVAPAEARKDVVVRIQEAAAAAPAVVAGRVVPVELNQQMEQQLRPILRGDLHLLRTVCDPTEDEHRALAEAAEEVLRSVAERLARQRMGQEQLGAGPVDPIERFSRSLAEAAAEILSPDRIGPFLAELDARKVARKDAGAGVFVAIVDQAVLLDDDQRERLHRGLIAAWDDSWHQVVELVQRNPQYLPGLPHQCLADVLDERQLRIWGGRQRPSARYSGIIFFQAMDNAALEPPAAGVDPAAGAPIVRP